MVRDNYCDLFFSFFLSFFFLFLFSLNQVRLFY